MNRIILVLKLAAVALPFALISYLFQFIFRQASDIVLIIFYSAIAIVTIYFYLKIRKQFLINNPGKKTPFYFDSSNIFFLIVGIIGGYFISLNSFKTNLYIDNGTGKIVTVKVPNEKQFDVNPNTYKKVKVPVDEIDKIVINNVTKELKINEKGNWVYNVDNVNAYVLSTLDYVNSSTLYNSEKKDSILSENESNSNFKLVHEEFFKTEASYLFDPPEKITTKSKNSPDKMTVTVLYRIGK